MIDDVLRVFKTEEYLVSPSRFQNFVDALNELTRKQYEGVIRGSIKSHLDNLEVYPFDKREVTRLKIKKIHEK